MVADLQSPRHLAHPLPEERELLSEDRGAFQNGSARTRSDADASTHKKSARRHADASDEANADR